MLYAVAAGSDSEEEPAEEQMRMTFLGTKHSRPQQRGVLPALQAEHPVSAPRAGLRRPLRHELHQPILTFRPP